MLIFGFGNPGRGDDALGPKLLAAIEAENIGGIECLNDMQLQVEHVTDLTGRARILFVDADVSCTEPWTLCKLSAKQDDSYTSHAMSPGALLHAFHKVYGEPAPPAYVLHIRAYQFGLGQPVSDKARENLQSAILLTQKLCRTTDNAAWNALP